MGQAYFPTETNDTVAFRNDAKDKSAFFSFYNQYAPALYSYIVVIVKDERLAETALQSTFIEMWTKGGAEHSYRSGFASLIATARNVVKDMNAGNAFENVPSSAAGGFDEKRVFELVYYCGLKAGEVSKNLGIPEVKVKELLRNAMKKINFAGHE